METYEITIIDLNTKDETIIPVQVDEAETTENIVISATVSDTKITSSDYAYLAAYKKFRDELLNLGFGIKCNGSRVNAVQSGMMEATDKTYLVETNKPAQMRDVVHIWDYADIDEFPDTEEQEDFYNIWRSVPVTGKKKKSIFERIFKR